jgi:hypothetical protein
VVTAANASDVAMLPDLLHSEETRVWGDGADQGQPEVIRECAPRAQDYIPTRAFIPSGTGSAPKSIPTNCRLFLVSF